MITFLPMMQVCLANVMLRKEGESLDRLLWMPENWWVLAFICE